MTRPHVCFVGCGAATRAHARRLSRMGARLSFASRSPDRAEGFRRKFDGVMAFGSYDQAVEDPSVDLVVVATPPGLHKATAEAAIHAGTAVALEKPAFPTSAEALFVLRLAESKRVPVFVLENYAYKPLLGLLQRVLASGWIGDARFVRVDALKRQRIAGWRTDRALAGGGAMLEGGIHWVSFMARLGPAVQRTRVVDAGDEALSSLVVFEYDTGMVGTLHHSWETPGVLGPLRRSRIDGTQGSVTFESNGLLTVVTGRRRRVHGPARDLLGFGAMWEDVLGALEENREPRYTLEDAREDLLRLEPPLPRSGRETERVGRPRSPLRGCGVQW